MLQSPTRCTIAKDITPSNRLSFERQLTDVGLLHCDSSAETREPALCHVEHVGVVVGAGEVEAWVQHQEPGGHCSTPTPDLQGLSGRPKILEPPRAAAAGRPALHIYRARAERLGQSGHIRHRGQASSDQRVDSEDGHQFQRPSRVAIEGTSKVRTKKVSSRMANAIVNPS